MTTVVEAMRLRRSLSKVTDAAPSHDELLDLVAAAGRVADHSSLKPWRIIEIRGSGRERLGRALNKAEGRKGVSTKPLRAPLLMLAGENGAQPAFSKKHLDCFYFGNYDQYDAAREYLKTFSIGGKNGEFLLVSTTEDIFADITLEHKLISQHWPDCYEDARSAAPTPLRRRG